MIEQKRLEAEAQKVQRLKHAEGEAEARRIESAGEAEARRKLAESDAYRAEVLGKANSEQLARESALIAKTHRCSSKDSGRQAVGQDPGHHRAADRGRVLRRVAARTRQTGGGAR